MISLNFPVLLLCYIVCILYSMKTFLVMVKLQSKLILLCSFTHNRDKKIVISTATPSS